MHLFNIIAILVTLSALFSFINYCYIKLPTTIGLMLIALVMSIRLIVLGKLGIDIGIQKFVALSLPDGSTRELFLTIIYVVVVFSIIVQGLTIKYLLMR